MSKLNLSCEAWNALHQNTLRGFAIIRIQELQLILRDVAVHEKDGRRWAQLPSRPQLKDGKAITDAAGKVQYFPTASFESREVADAFSAAVIAAVLKREPNAFTADAPAARATAANGVRDAVDDSIPF
jgi:hypothetical protein